MIEELKIEILTAVRKHCPSSIPSIINSGEDSGSFICLVLNVPASEIRSVKAVIRSYRDRSEALGLDLFPIVKDQETTVQYYPDAIKNHRRTEMLEWIACFKSGRTASAEELARETLALKLLADFKSGFSWQHLPGTFGEILQGSAGELDLAEISVIDPTPVNVREATWLNLMGNCGDPFCSEQIACAPETEELALAA